MSITCPLDGMTYSNGDCGHCTCQSSSASPAACSIPVLNWSEIVGKRLEPARLYDGGAKVMNEYCARKMILDVLAMYGIYPNTEE